MHAKPIEKLLSTQGKMLALWFTCINQLLKIYYVCNAKVLHCGVTSCKQLLATEKAVTFNNIDDHMLEYLFQLHHNTLTHNEVNS